MERRILHALYFHALIEILYLLRKEASQGSPTLQAVATVKSKAHLLVLVCYFSPFGSSEIPSLESFLTF